MKKTIDTKCEHNIVKGNCRLVGYMLIATCPRNYHNCVYHGKNYSECPIYKRNNGVNVLKGAKVTLRFYDLRFK